MTKQYRALITAEVLLWARTRINMPLEIAAKKLDVEPERLAAWERGEDYPSFSKAKDIARVYKRPLAIFYLPEPPDATDMLHDFRRLPDMVRVGPSSALLLEIERAEIQRSIALQLLPASERDFDYLDTISLDDDPERVGEQIRGLLNITLEDQYEWKGDRSLAFRHWKDRIERLHVLVLQTTHIRGEGFELEEARGFSIGESALPVIMINAKDAPAGRIFTLLHEFAHLLLNSTGICDLLEVRRPTTQEQQIEVFCNRVAAAALVPAKALVAQPTTQRHGNAEEWTEDEINRLARTFSVSNDSMVRRLATLGFTTVAFYSRKHAEYQDLYAKLRLQPKQDKRVPYELLVVRRNGVAFTRLVLEAYYQDRITLNKVASYLGISLKTMAKVEHAAFANLVVD
ncbi:MAG: XRE family transcriptional regulator [Caldilineaceae bacterium]